MRYEISLPSFLKTCFGNRIGGGRGLLSHFGDDFALIWHPLFSHDKDTPAAGTAAISLGLAQLFVAPSFLSFLGLPSFTTFLVGVVAAVAAVLALSPSAAAAKLLCAATILPGRPAGAEETRTRSALVRLPGRRDAMLDGGGT